MYKIFNIINYLPVILFFLPAFTFWVPFLNGGYLFFSVSIYIALIYMALKYKRRLISIIYKVIRKTPLKIFIIILFLISVNVLVQAFIGFVGLVSSLRAVIMQICLCILPTLIYFLLLINKEMSYKKFTKIFLFLFWINLLIGFVSYIGQLFDIKFINTIFSILANSRYLVHSHSSYNYGVDEQDNYMANGIPRLDNLYEEPGFYARFLFLFLPFIYAFASSHITICKKKLLNFVIKNSMVIFTWISLILTLSPIFLVFSILLTVILYFDRILIFLKKYLFLVILSFILSFTLLYTNFENTNTSTSAYIGRITRIFTVNSFEEFLKVEPSLGTRVVGSINAFYVAYKHFLFGVGFAHVEDEHIMAPQYLNSPVPLTYEIIAKSNANLNFQNKVAVPAFFICRFFAENGIILTLLLFYFMHLLDKNLKKIMLSIDKKSFDYIYIKALRGCLIALLLQFFYELNFLQKDFYLIIALCVSIIYKYAVLKQYKIKQVTIRKV